MRKSGHKYLFDNLLCTIMHKCASKSRISELIIAELSKSLKHNGDARGNLISFSY
jgi:hypothetical protein